MIQHTVAFRLNHPQDSEAENAFLEASLELTEIPGVRNFRRFRQVSTKAPFTFGLSMDFENQAAYDAYCVHRIHTRFVEERWIPEVAEFQEIDYTTYP
jgi:hypothetical protein